MDKQIVFYNNDYQFYYSPKNKTISSPQRSDTKEPNFYKKKLLYYLLIAIYLFVVSGLNPLTAIMAYEISTAVIEMVLLCISIHIFLKIKVYFVFSPKWLWYILFPPFYSLGLFVSYMTVAPHSNKINIDILPVVHWVLFIGVGILLTSKKRISVQERKEFVDTAENKKMLREVLLSNDVNYKGIIIFETIVLGFIANLFLRNGIDQTLMFALPLFIVAIFQKNIYYLLLIRKIAKKYGISLKSKDVIAENDAQAEKELNAEKEIISQTDTEIKNEIDTGNKTNLETNTQINTEEN